MGDLKKDQKHGVDLKERGEEKLQRPPMYRVLIHNDDFTPIGFVAELIATVFRKSPEEAANITLEIHNKGAGIAGVYTHEIAETKVALAEMYVQEAEHPLMLSLEPDS